MTTEIETLQRMFDEIAEREGAPRLELDEDGAAAAANIGQLAIVDDGPDAKTVGSAGRSGVGFLKRLFNTEASRKVNAEVVADFKRAMVRAYGERIAVGIDIRDGYPAIKGWKELSGETAEAAFTRLCEAGAKTIICTDISRDGAMKGIDEAFYRELVQKYTGGYGCGIVASGEASAHLRWRWQNAEYM